MPDALAPHRVAAYFQSAVGYPTSRFRCHGDRPVSTNGIMIPSSLTRSPHTEGFSKVADAIRVATCTEVRSMRTSWFIPPTEVGVAPPQPEGQGHGSGGADKFACTRTKRSPIFWSLQVLFGFGLVAGSAGSRLPSACA